MPRADLSVLKIDDSARSRRRGRWLPWLLIPLAAAVIAIGVGYAIANRAPRVQVLTVHPASTGANGATTLLNASGYVTPRRRATVAAKITARVEQIYAEEGMRVKAGQVLAVLDESDSRVRLNSAVADRD